MPMLAQPLVQALALAATVVNTTPPSSPHDQLWALFNEEWDWQEAAYPEGATENGDDRFDDRLTDWSIAAIMARHQHERDELKRAEAFDRASLSPDDQLNLELFVYALNDEVGGFRFPRELLQLNQLDSPPSEIGQLARAIPRAHVKDLENFLARLKAVPAQIDQQIALLRQGAKMGVTPPQITLGEIPKLLASHTPADPTQSPIYLTVFADLPATVPDADKARLQAQAKEILSGQVIPAYRKLAAFAKDEYVPKARKTLAAMDLPDGKAWYAYDVEDQTTTHKTPDEIHAIGLAEVDRIQKEMDAVQKQTGFKGDRQAFFEFLKKDKRFYFTSADALLSGFRDIAKRIDPVLPQHFKTLPRLTYGVQAMPDYQARTSPAAYYEPGSPDVGRPGYFMANTYDLKSRPKWAMEDLTLHEAVPGHHLQIARAQELGKLPKFRRYTFYNAFGEGWALYCEGLGDELGLYKDPYSKLGQLSGEMWRAVRLVVDTGIHSEGWTREQAIAFFHDHTGQPELNARVEVDRYIVWPGQALGYKIGQLDIRALRAEAEQKLGDRFDEREFHDQILGAGALPLSVLDRRIHDWISSQGLGQPTPN
jgi:uncharacterized protein (DUF885 family)